MATELAVTQSGCDYLQSYFSLGKKYLFHGSDKFQKHEWKFKKRSESRSLVSSSFFRALSCHLKLLRDITSYVILFRYRSTAFGPHIAIDCSLIMNSRRVSCRDFSCHLIEAKELLLQLLSV